MKIYVYMQMSSYPWHTLVITCKCFASTHIFEYPRIHVYADAEITSVCVTDQTKSLISLGLLTRNEIEKYTHKHMYADAGNRKKHTHIHIDEIMSKCRGNWRSVWFHISAYTHMLNAFLHMYIYLTYFCIAASMHILNRSLIFLHAYVYWNTHTHTCTYADAEITSVCHGVDEVSDLLAIAYNTTVYTHIYVCMHMYTNICTCIRIYINLYVYICIEKFMCLWRTRYIWICMYVHT